MKRSLKLNPALAYRKKNGIYAFYLDFNYIFIYGRAAELIDQILEAIVANKCIDFLPGEFLEYLIKKQIILEEQS